MSSFSKPYRHPLSNISQWPILFTWVDSDRTQGNGFHLKERSFRSDVQGKFFTERVVRCWHRLPREVEDALSLEVFKARLDGALGSLV